ncbi:uncharacterized protein LOC111032986 [Myzus persicae]|uniref:uncharacterized protein LOC111032986 n=1 Tax=Myzus persicae TaxID=13164 RepID=UPI000B938B61|nr:uncharacterized protein LOC111032986 [Myzus persicae]
MYLQQKKLHAQKANTNQLKSEAQGVIMNPVVPPLQVIRRPFKIQGNAKFTSIKMSASELNELVNDAEIRLTNDGKDFILGIYTKYWQLNNLMNILNMLKITF